MILILHGSPYQPERHPPNLTFVQFRRQNLLIFMIIADNTAKRIILPVHICIIVRYAKNESSIAAPYIKGGMRPIEATASPATLRIPLLSPNDGLSKLRLRQFPHNEVPSK